MFAQKHEHYHGTSLGCLPRHSYLYSKVDEREHASFLKPVVTHINEEDSFEHIPYYILQVKS
jgi:hypothetical protein